MNYGRISEWQKGKKSRLSTVALLSTVVLTVAVVCLRFARPVRADNITWDGGGVTNNWSEAANWTNDTLPGANDSVFFDATSTKDCIIDVNVSMAGLRINAGYTGAVTQAGSSTLTIANLEFRQASGTFNGGGGFIDVNSPFSLSGGSFNSSTGTLFLGAAFSHNGGVFNHNNGTVTFDGDGGSLSVSQATDTFNNVNFSKNDGVSMSVSGPAADPAFRTIGTLALNDGQLFGGSIEADGDVTISPNFDAAPDALSPATLIIAGSAPRTITWAAGARLLNVTLNAPNVTLQASGAGTLTWRGLSLQNGTINQGSVDFDFKNSYNQTGGVFNASGNTINFRGPFAQNGGTFNGGSGSIDADSTFNLSGAVSTFTSTSGTLFVAGSFSHSSGSFNHNGGTLTIDGGGSMTISQPGEAFNNLTFDLGAGVSKALFGPGGGNPIFKTLGTLNLSSGTIFGGDPIEAQGDVTIGPNFGGGISQPLTFSGAANQTFTNNGGVNPNVTWTVNKTSGTVTALSSIILGTNQTLNITSGTLYLNNGSNLTCGPLTIGAGGRLVSDSTTTITLGGNLANSGKVDLLGGGAACPESDSILIRSSSSGTQRSWSNPVGSGQFRLIDVDVKDMAGTAAITVFSGTNSGNNGANWTFDPNCPISLSISPATVDRFSGQTQTFTAGGGFPPQTFSLPVNNSGATINSSTGLYTAGTAINVSDTVRVTDSFGQTADATVNVYAGPANKLAFTVQPANAVVGQAITPSIQVAVQDSQGRTVANASNSVTLAIANNSGGSTLSGTVTRNAVNGIATFDNISLNKTGTGYTLSAAAASLTSATSTGFNVTPGQPALLAFRTQPTDTAAGAIMSPPVEVELRDQFNNFVPTATDPVTLYLTSSTGPNLDPTIDPLAQGFSTEGTSQYVFGGAAVIIQDFLQSGHRIFFKSVPAIGTSDVATDVRVVVSTVSALDGVDTGVRAILDEGTGGKKIAAALIDRGNGDKRVALVKGDGTFTNGIPLNWSNQAIFRLEHNTDPARRAVLTVTGQTPEVLTDAQLPPGNRPTPSFEFGAVSDPAAANVGFFAIPNLPGTIVRNAINGVAAFDDLNIGILGNDYTLTAKSNALTPVTSNPFDVFNDVITTLYVTNTNDSGVGSLRQAILNSNSIGGTQTIGFNIPGSAPFTISPLTNLPEITDPVILDGTTQPGYSGSPLIQLRGINIGAGGSGIRIKAGNSTVKGFVLNRWSQQAILLETGGGNTIQGNFIGTDATGISAEANLAGITLVNSSNNLIGGPAAAARNLISASGTNGVSTQGSGNIIQGNYIGTNITGTAALPNKIGISLQGTSTSVLGNVISGNPEGIAIRSSAHTIKGNFVGTNAAGTDPLPNGTGIEAGQNASLVSNAVIGGILPGEANVIAFNTNNGVVVRDSAHGVTIRGNSIHSNGGLGVDLGGDGVTTNDACDPDGGANDRQNFPVLVSVGPAATPGHTYFTFQLNTTASRNYIIDFYSNAVGEANGFGEGKTYLGSGTINTEQNCTPFANTFDLPIQLGFEMIISATATDENGNTSEFSQVASNANISGFVQGAARVGTTVELRNTANGPVLRTALTAQEGTFSFKNLNPGGNYLVSVKKNGYAFTPSSRTYNNLNGTVSGTYDSVLITYSISGQVTVNGASLGGVTMSLDPTHATQTDSSGNYSFFNLVPGTYTVTPSKLGYSFTPASMMQTISDNTTINFTSTSLQSGLGGRIVFKDGNRIRAMNANGSGLATLYTDSSSGVAMGPNLSFDGTKVVFPRVAGSWNVLEMNFDGSSQTQLNLPDLNRSIVRIDDIVFSHDRSKLAFSSKPVTDFFQRVFAVSSGGGTVTQLTSSGNPNSDHSPDWSPDGTKLVLIRGPGLFTVNSNGSGLTPLAINNGDQRYPRWSPDGNTIAFFRSSTIVRRDVLSGTETVVRNGSPSDGFLGWKPDSLRLIFSKYVSNAAPHVITSIMAADGSGEVELGNGTYPSWGKTPISAGGTGTIGRVTHDFAGSARPSAANETPAETSVVPISPASAGPVPNGYNLGPFAYDISTTATFTPPVSICFTVDPDVYTTAAQFDKLRLLHNEGGTLVDQTVLPNDFANRKVCASVSSLSPFVLAELTDPALPSITGLVIDENGNALGDFPVGLSGDETRNTLTNSEGIFNFTNLQVGGNYAVTPQKIGYLFDFPSQSYIGITGENTFVFTATPANFDISGTVTDENGQPVQGVAINLSGSAESDTTTDMNGHYSFTDLPANASFVVTASSENLVFEPAQIVTAPLEDDEAEVNFISQPCLATTISAPPVSQTACPNTPVGFSVSATGTNLTYQWRKNGAPLSNSGNILGADTATLTINSVNAADAASYDVIVSGTCGSQLSDSVSLVVSAFGLSSTVQGFPAAGGAGNVNVTNTNSCGWTAVSNDSFIHITNGSSGSGNGTVSFNVDPTSSARIGTITVAGATVTVIQQAPPNPNAPSIFSEEDTISAIALDSVTLVRGPFKILTDHNFSADHHTRVILFTSNLGLTQPNPAMLTVQAAGFSLVIENVGPVTGVSGLDASYIIVRLPDGLPAGNLPLTVTLNGNTSSIAILSISP